LERTKIVDSRAKNKPRVCDYIRSDNGVEEIEIKHKNWVRRILLQDMIWQIQEARKTISK
jgi:hypothetical protein